MGRKILLELEDDKIKALDDFVHKVGYKHRVDGVRLLIDLSKKFNDSIDSVMISASDNSVSILKSNCAINISKEDSPEVQGLTMVISYDEHGKVTTDITMQQNI